MGLSEAVKTVLRKKYATFQGRASRSEYWWFTLFYWLVFLAFAVLYILISAIIGDYSLSSAIHFVVMVPAAIFMIALIVPVLALQVRRLHDRNMSGWWYLGLTVLGFIPYVGFIASIALLVISAMKGTDGPNKFGPDPLRPQATAEVFA